MKKPFVTIILPTYNSQSTLNECLKGLCNQEYRNYEILLIDGGSTDKTLKIAKRYKVKIINNPHRVEEKARILGIENSAGELLCFIDADNIILEKNWLKKMVIPFEDETIIGADTYYFSARKQDNLITHYCSLIGGDDPIAVYLGVHDRYNYFKKNWTGLNYYKEKKKGYLKIKLDKAGVPAMGSNGFIFRKRTLLEINYTPFIHTDIVYKLADKGYFAKVNTGIVHLQGNLKDFFNKKIRRIKRRIFGEIKLEHNYSVSKKKILIVLIYLMLGVPFYDAIKGFIRKPNSAWFFHPIATYLIVFMYSFYILKNKLETIFKK
mgnify:CR=1 FL=1